MAVVPFAVVMGVVAILYRYMVGNKQLEDFVLHNPWFLPILLLAPMGFGVFVQQMIAGTLPRYTPPTAPVTPPQPAVQTKP